MELPLTNKDLFIINEHGWFIYHEVTKKRPITFVKEGLMAGWKNKTSHYYHRMNNNNALAEGIEIQWEGNPFNLEEK